MVATPKLMLSLEKEPTWIQQDYYEKSVHRKYFDGYWHYLVILRNIQLYCDGWISNGHGNKQNYSERINSMWNRSHKHLYLHSKPHIQYFEQSRDLLIKQNISTTSIVRSMITYTNELFFESLNCFWKHVFACFIQFFITMATAQRVLN